MSHLRKSHRLFVLVACSSSSARCAAIVPSVSLSSTRMLASRESSFVVNLEEIILASIVTAEVSSSEFMAYHLFIGYACVGVIASSPL